MADIRVGRVARINQRTRRGAQNVAIDLLIFDCDGVLVDSELISMGVLLNTILDHGLVIDPTEAYERFLGKSLTTIAQILGRSYGLTLTHTALEQMRLTLYDRFRS